MKIYKLFLLTLMVSGLVASCSKDADDIGPVEQGSGEERDLTVEKFVYRGMNEIYLYKADVPQLEDGYFSNVEERNDFLDNYATPEDLFYDGLVAPQDRFSWIVDDYIELERSFSGISTTTGMNYGLARACAGCEELVGYVRYVLPNTSAEEKGIERGNYFNRINGELLTISNYRSLLAPDSFTISLVQISNGEISSTGETVTLTKQEYTENPVFISKILEVDGKNVAYLMYNRFTADFDRELNDAFGTFLAAGVTDLVLDLRYNPGGRTSSASHLASMITGQFAGEVFSREQWNAKYQNHFEQNNPESLVNKFKTKLLTNENINSLNLNRVFILTTRSSASSSELVLIGLEPYIDVIHIGEKTVGKFQASVTLYDSPNFGRQNANTTHTYAIQPLVLKSSNADGFTDFVEGLVPDYPVDERLSDLGILGDPNEPLLKTALDIIKGNRISIPQSFENYPYVGESGMFEPDFQKMYIDKLPEVIQND